MYTQVKVVSHEGEALLDGVLTIVPRKGEEVWLTPDGPAYIVSQVKHDLSTTNIKVVVKKLVV
jgi:hypothetical protein